MEILYTVNEVAKQFGVTRTTIYKWMADGSLPYVMVGQRRRIPEWALKAFIRPAAEGKK